MDKAQMKSLKQLSRSELLEVMLALKRENDILRVENVRLNTLKHKLEQHITEITDTLQDLKRGTYEGEIGDYAFNNSGDTAADELDGSFGGGYADASEDDFDSLYGESNEKQHEDSDGYSFESMFDSYVDGVTNRD